jgi:hypothetical protein
MGQTGPFVLLKKKNSRNYTAVNKKLQIPADPDYYIR